MWRVLVARAERRGRAASARASVRDFRAVASLRERQVAGALSAALE
jgi:hypothetical protein